MTIKKEADLKKIIKLRAGMKKNKPVKSRKIEPSINTKKQLLQLVDIMSLKRHIKVISQIN